MKCQVNIGSIVKFDYPQGNEHDENVIGRVMGIRDIELDPISFKTQWYTTPIKRSRYLLTVAVADGKIRTFYNEVARNARHCSIIERVWMYLTGVTFPKFSAV